MPWAKSRPSSDSRGYGHAHRQARAAYLAAHQPSHPCVRCGKPLGPAGPWLHLDHNRTRDGYLGLAHARCNKQAGAREGRARQTSSRLRW